MSAVTENLPYRMLSHPAAPEFRTGPFRQYFHRIPCRSMDFRNHEELHEGITLQRCGAGTDFCRSFDPGRLLRNDAGTLESNE